MSFTINRVIMNITDRINVVNVAYEQNIYTLFYKQHNYKERQAEPLLVTLKIIHILHPRYQPK